MEVAVYTEKVRFMNLHQFLSSNVNQGTKAGKYNEKGVMFDQGGHRQR